MVGGNNFTSVPYQYSKGLFNFTNVGFTSGPTVRRPIRISLHNSTLTAIGYFSVDFMDTTTKLWTHNAQLTDVMAKLYDTTTVAHLNFVFVVGGISSATQQQSTSLWVIDSPTSAPNEVQNVTSASSKEFVGSWFDEDHEAVVFQFFTQCLVYHTSSQQWFLRATLNNSVSSVSYQNSTIVFFTDGYWTLDWHSMTDTWTSLDQVKFAFTIADQLVYCAGDQMSIVTPTSTDTRSLNATITLATAMSSSIYVLVTVDGTVFRYHANTKQLIELTNYSTGFKMPLRLFRVNDTLVHLVGLRTDNTSSYRMIGDSETYLFPNAPIRSIPDLLMDGHYFNFAKGVVMSIDQPAQVASYFIPPVNALIWTQQGDICYWMLTADVTSKPASFVQYQAIDVYNYVDNKWEDSIPIPSILNAGGAFLPIAVLDNTLCIITAHLFLQLNETGVWTIHEAFFSGPMLPLYAHPTYAPVSVVNNTAYLIELGASLLVTSTAVNVRRLPSGISAFAKQSVKTDTKIIVSLASSAGIYTQLSIFDIATETWATTLYQQRNMMVSIVPYDGWLLALGDDMLSFNYLNVTTLQWYNQPFNNPFVPASMFTLTQSNGTTLVLAGGYHRTGYYYTDEVAFVTLNLTEDSVSTPAAEPTASVTGPDTTDTSTIVVAVVIPIGVVAIAGAILIVFLVHRKQRRKRATSTSTVGLEQQFGQWFVPFSDIRFGAQLGQGANGQVFKGKWKNTDVALKMSMTQANQSVISELSLMINLRPHPNVVQLFGFSVNPETNSIILILEYCDGGSLDETLYGGTGVIKIETKLYWLKSICKGISHLHANNLVHRDIAARNVMLHKGEPKLTDLGMTRVVDEQQQHGTTKSELGPIRWMAPESLKSKQYSTKSGTLNITRSKVILIN